MLRSILSLIRAGNLIIICLIFLLIRHTIIIPWLQFEGMASSLDNFSFLLLMLSTVLIAAGGNIINDVFDTGIDEINKPGKNPVGKLISVFTAKVLYASFTLAGVTIAWWFGEKTGIRYTMLVMILCSGLLYFYSSSYKKMFLVGNLVIAVLAGTAVMITILFDTVALQNSYVVTLVSAYAVFAVAMTLVREVIKDCEDYEGDGFYGAQTLPLTLGLSAGRYTAAFVCLLVFCSILWIQITQKQWEALLPFAYVSVFIQVPLMILLIRLIRAREKHHDRMNSHIAKLVMITGILSMIVFHFTF